MWHIAAMREYTDPAAPGAPQAGVPAGGRGTAMSGIYTDPDEPGAPKPGDLVVVAIDGAPGTSWEHHTDSAGDLVRVLGDARVAYPDDRSATHHRWQLGAYGEYGDEICHAVRWPTPAELAAYQLGQGDGC